LSAESADKIVCVCRWPLKKQNLLIVIDHDIFISKYTRKEYLNYGLHNLSDQGAQINGNGRMEIEWNRKIYEKG